jgi:hypothetical protein
MKKVDKFQLCLKTAASLFPFSFATFLIIQSLYLLVMPSLMIDFWVLRFWIGTTTISITTLSIMTLGITTSRITSFRAECCYAEFTLYIVMLSVVMVIAVRLTVLAPSNQRFWICKTESRQISTLRLYKDKKEVFWRWKIKSVFQC